MKKLLYLLPAIIITCQAVALPLDRSTFGIAKDFPVYLQEWHIWWGFPYPDRQRPISHLSSTFTAQGEPWRLDWNRNGYPYPGIYDAANIEVARWQMRCIKATGVTSVAIMIHPEMNKGLDFIQEKNDLIGKLLDLAAEEKYPVFFMDEVAFRKGSVAQDPEVMAKRVIHFLQRYGKHPGFYKIDGRPVYYFQTFGFGITPEQMTRMFATVEKTCGPVHWMIFGDIKRFGKVPQLRTVICGSSGHRRDSSTREWQLRNQDPQGIFEAGRQAGKKIGDIHYPKFDGTSQPWRQSGVASYGEGGRRLETTVKDSLRFHPDLLMFSSWNDWEEGANFEPGWDFDGFAGDPFLFCRVLAHLRGREFVPPPPPPKTAVHPTIWEKLGYGDGAGPLIEKIERSHNRGGALTVTVRDTVSPVTDLEVIWEGDLYWKAPQPGGKEAGGKLKLTAGKLGTNRANINPLGFSGGNGSEAGKGTLEFNAPDLIGFNDGFAVGAVYAFDPENPLDQIGLTLPNKFPIELAEPKGGISTTTTLQLGPYPRDNRFPSEIWNGWRSECAVAPRLVDFAKAPLKLQVNSQLLGQLSLLGSPRPERFFSGSKEKIDDKGLQQRFYLELPESVLGKPGLHVLWLRARDAAGNWGSPRLYAVPNYEAYNRRLNAVTEPPLQVKNAVFTDNGTNPGQWRAVEQKPLKTTIERTSQFASRLELDNGLAVTTLKTPLNDAFVLRFKARHTNWQRSVIVWLTDAAGKQGYGVIWNSAATGQFNNEGVTGIRRLRQEEPLRWSDSGTKLGNESGSGHFALGPELAEFELRRDTAGRLELKVDGRKVATAADPGPIRFERLYLRGNRSQILDDISVAANPD